MTFMSWAIFILSIIIVCYAGYFIVKGRRVDRGIMVWNMISGFWLMSVYLVVIYDEFLRECLTPREITVWLIRPVVFVLGFIILSNCIRISRHG